MSKNILLIGCGNIGYRHLQALTSIQCICNEIYIIEKNEKRVEELKKIINEFKIEKIIRFFYAMEEFLNLNINIFCAISSVTSDHQLEIIKVLANKNIQYVVLEKPIAQSYSDCLEIEKISECFKGVYVNLPRTLWSGYKNIRNKLKPNIKLKVSGVNWGYGCNAIHYIDLFRYLTSSTIMTLENAILLKNSSHAKRGSDFEDFSGSCLIYGNNMSNSLELTCIISKESEISSSIFIDNNERFIIVSENASKWFDFNIKNKSNLGSMYVSVSSTFIINDLINENKCDLPLLKEAMISHKVFFESLQRTNSGRNKFNIT